MNFKIISNVVDVRLEPYLFSRLGGDVFNFQGQLLSRSIHRGHSRVLFLTQKGVAKIYFFKDSSGLNKFSQLADLHRFLSEMFVGLFPRFISSSNVPRQLLLSLSKDELNSFRKELISVSRSNVLSEEEVSLVRFCLAAGKKSFFSFSQTASLFKLLKNTGSFSARLALNCGVVEMEKGVCSLLDLIRRETYNPIDLSLKVLKSVKLLQVGGVVHRDIKSGNIMQRPDGSLFFVDMDSVRLKSFFNESSYNFCGTPEYMMPWLAECFRGSDSFNSNSKFLFMDSADIWAACVVVFELFTKLTPYDVKSSHFGRPASKLSLQALKYKSVSEGFSGDYLLRSLERKNCPHDLSVLLNRLFTCEEFFEIPSYLNQMISVLEQLSSQNSVISNPKNVGVPRSVYADPVSMSSGNQTKVARFERSAPNIPFLAHM